MASANRLIELRHDCRNSSRMAEIRVPACPIPIHQTKFTMAKPQPIGMVTPHMPVPRTNRYPMANNIIIVSRKAMPKPRNQPLEVGRVRTIELILSVTVPKVYPGSMTGAASPSATGCLGSSISRFVLRLFQLRIGVANLGQIRRPRPRVQIAQQTVVARVCLQLRNPAVGIVDIAKDDR